MTKTKKLGIIELSVEAVRECMTCAEEFFLIGERTASSFIANFLGEEILDIEF